MTRNKGWMSHAAALAGALLLAAGANAAAPATDKPVRTLRIGDPAPAFEPMRWLKGQPVKLEKGKLYLLEFWFVGCGPCEQIMPHLSEVQKKYQGKLTVIGVDASEHSSDLAYTNKEVDKFMRKKGDKLMQYAVAMDDPVKDPIARAWTQSEDLTTGDGMNGYPRTFLVNKEGRIVWMGNPVNAQKDNRRLDRVIAGLVDGSFDVAAANKERDYMTAMKTKSQDKEKVADELRKPYFKAIEAKDWPGAVAAAERYIAEMERQFGKNPNYEVALSGDLFVVRLRANEAKGLAYAKSKVEDTSTYVMVEGQDPVRYWLPANITDSIGREPGFSPAVYRYAIGITEREFKATPAMRENAYMVAGLAAAYRNSGNVPKAIELMKEAIARQEKSDFKVIAPELQKDMMEKFAKQLADYQSELGKKKSA